MYAVTHIHSLSVDTVLLASLTLVTDWVSELGH